MLAFFLIQELAKLIPTQGLCTCYFLFLKHSSPGILRFMVATDSKLVYTHEQEITGSVRWTDPTAPIPHTDRQTAKKE